MCAFGISRHPRGAALVIVMLVMAVLLMAGTTFLTISSTESQIALNEQGSARALVLAEAAIHKAIASLNDSVRGPAYLANNGEMNTMLGGGTFTLSFAPSSLPTSTRCPNDNSKDLIATASVPVRGGQAQVQLQVTVDTVAYPYRWAAYGVPPSSDWWGLFLYSSRVDSFDSTLGPYGPTNSGRHGDIGANGDLYLWSSIINGNVKATGDISSWGSTVSGAQVPNATSEIFPTFTPSGIPACTVVPLSYGGSGAVNVPAAGAVTLSRPTSSSLGCYVTTINMGAGATLATSGSVTIYVTGSVSTGDNVTFGSPTGTPLRMVTKSDGDGTNFSNFQAGQNFVLYGSLYGRNTDFNFWAGNAQIYGSVIGRTLWAWNAQFHYNQFLANQGLCNNPKFTIRRGTWREVIPST